MGVFAEPPALRLGDDITVCLGGAWLVITQSPSGDVSGGSPTTQFAMSSQLRTLLKFLMGGRCANHHEQKEKCCFQLLFQLAKRARWNIANWTTEKQDVMRGILSSPTFSASI